MKLTATTAIFAITLLLTSTTINCYEDVCQCKKYNPPLAGQEIEVKPLVEVQIDFYTFDTPVAIGDEIFLTKHIPYSQPSYKELKDTCPSGYKVPTFEELDFIFAREEYSYDKLSELLRVEGDITLLTNTKAYDTLVMRDYRAWMFKGFSFAYSKVEEHWANTYWDTQLYLPCMKQSQIVLEGHLDSFLVGKTYELKVTDPNLQNVYFYFTDKVHMGSSLKFEFERSGCFTVNVFASEITGRQLQSCYHLYVEFPMGSESERIISVDDIVETGIDGEVKRIPNMLWMNGNPMLTASEEGILFALYSNTEGNLKVAKINEMTTDVVLKDLGVKGLAIDIYAMRSQIVVFYQDYEDTNASFILYLNKDMSVKYKTTVMNNGPSPTKPVDQITFFNKDNEPMGGMEAMLVANKGKIVSGFNRIGVLFSHYNHFGFKDGERDDHQGDTLVFLDKETGKPVSYGWSWKTSHSLDQEQIFDGRYFITASLGDVYPENIQLCAVDISKFNNTRTMAKEDEQNQAKCIDAVPGFISGDAKGRACGRLGGLFTYDDHIYVVYSRRSCTSSVITQSTVSEIALLKLKINDEGVPELITKTTLKNDAEKVHNLRASRFGKSIIILYSDEDVPAARLLSFYHHGEEKVFMMQTDFDGKVLYGPEETGSDDIPVGSTMIQGRNGDTYWLTVDDDGALILNALEALDETKLVSDGRIGTLNPQNIDDLPFDDLDIHRSAAVIHEYIEAPMGAVPTVNTINLFNELEVANDWKNLF